MLKTQNPLMLADCTTQQHNKNKVNYYPKFLFFCVAKPKMLALTKSTKFMATHTQQTQTHTFGYIEHC